MTGPLASWLPAGRMGAICLSVDDVHPTAAEGAHEIGGIAREALGHLAWLLERHPHLHATLFTTPDWRSRGVVSSRGPLRRLPVVRRMTYSVPPWPRGTLRLDRHAGFMDHVRDLPRTDIGLHGLHHVRRGVNNIEEFAGHSRAACRRMLAEGQRILASAGTPPALGVTPPGWTAPPALLQAMADLRLSFIASARDLDTPITPDARASGSGLRGVSLIHPEVLPQGALVHITTNFQATSTEARAIAILEHGGVLSIKAHLLTTFGAYRALDGLNADYIGALDRLFMTLENRFGDRLWWPSMAELAAHARQAGLEGTA